MYSLTSRWNIKPGCEAAAKAALKKLAKDVQKNEPDTLLYLVHTPDMSQTSLPGVSPQAVLFVESYKNKAAFNNHVNGPVFQQFLTKHRGLFEVFPGDTNPFMQVEFLRREAGFVRPSP